MVCYGWCRILYGTEDMRLFVVALNISLMDVDPAGTVDYEELGGIADTLLEECDDDVALLAVRLDRLPGPVRTGLLCSDFLNAYQVFYYFFRQVPPEIEMERMLLLPASELQYGIRLNEIELMDLIFAVLRDEPIIVVHDGDRELARFTGDNAYAEGMRYIESML